jgi:mRNA interferase HigB
VRIVNEERLAGFIREHPEAKSALLRWSTVTKTSQWRTLADTRNTFRSADQVCECTVFDILGNNYRLITRIYYAAQTITLYHFLTHKEYDRGRWKKDCDC